MARNRGWTYRLRAGADDDGRPLADLLAARYAHSPAAVWRQRAADGQLTLDAVPASGDTIVSAGQLVVWQRPPWDEPDVPATFTVIHEDADLLVVDKPSGLPTMPAGGFLEHTLLRLLAARYGQVAPAHRLGRFTSGLVLCTRTARAAAAVAAAWRAHSVTKIYRALVSGTPAWNDTVIRVPIGPVPGPRLDRVFAADAAGRAAESHARVIERRGATTLVEVRITTGRPHQIRIHLAAAGHPLAGDPLYVAGGRPDAASTALPGDGGYHLHAARLALAHPATGDLLDLAAPVPPLLRSAGESPAPGDATP